MDKWNNGIMEYCVIEYTNDGIMIQWNNANKRIMDEWNIGSLQSWQIRNLGFT